MDAWERDWRSYQACFEAKVELRDARRANTRELVKALADHAGVHPDQDGRTLVAADAHQVTFGDLRRDAAEEAMEAVEAHDAARAARQTVEALTRREQGALDSLEQLVLAEEPPAEIQAQADKVATLHRQLTESRGEAREAEAAADREQAQANRAARHLEAAEAGRPRLVAEPVRGLAPDPDQPVGLEDRLG